MRITVTTESQSLIDILWHEDLKKLLTQKENISLRVTIQNLWASNIYLENSWEATAEWWYKIAENYETQINSKDIYKFNIISEWAENDNVRIITT